MSTSEVPKVLLYAQHLSGVGHYVRSYEIARALSSESQVYWIEGGRPVPHRSCKQLQVVELPRILRNADGNLRPLNNQQPIEQVIEQRCRTLLEAIGEIHPDVFLVEYFPFSKWELAQELLPAIQAVRRQGGLVICSIRDIVQQTRFEMVDSEAYVAQVLAWLAAYFDALLVHGDPDLIPLEASFPAVALIPLPIHYTGIVSEKLSPSPGSARAIDALCQGMPYALVSCGGSNGGQALMSAMIDVWRDPRIAEDRQLILCGGLAAESFEALSIPAELRNRIHCLPFRPDFLHWLALADLSISQCGYNTAANLLETGARAVISAHALMSDQRVRATCLASRGLASLAAPGSGPEALSRAIGQAPARVALTHRIRLDGAQETARVVASLMSR